MTATMHLVVDLDGTLLKSDMLHESFWGAFGVCWIKPFAAFAKIFKGKAEFKHYLSIESDIDAALLPYNEEVIAFIRNYRKSGGLVVLATASSQKLAQNVSAHLGLFDEVYGSSDKTNLKGPVKAEFLVERFGRGNFCYIGNSSADLSIWQAAGKIVTVNAVPSVRKKAEALGKPIEHLKAFDRSWRPYMSALRPHQWLKNLLVFLPMLAAHEFHSTSFVSCVLAFTAFCWIASSVYVLNDLLDLAADREHPRKRLRPFASGAVPISHGSVIALILLAGGAATAAILSWMFFLTIAAYYVLALSYSLFFKRKLVIDICILAGFYAIRILAGGVATGIELSVWLLAFSIFFFLSLGAVKRQAELFDMAQNEVSTTKRRGYTTQDLPVISMIGLAAGYISVLVMALYVTSPDVLKLYPNPEMLWGICCIQLYWVTRVTLITHRGSMHDDPVVFAITDRVSRLCLVVVLGFVAAGALL